MRIRAAWHRGVRKKFFELILSILNHHHEDFDRCFIDNSLDKIDSALTPPTWPIPPSDRKRLVVSWMQQQDAIIMYCISGGFVFIARRFGFFEILIFSQQNKNFPPGIVWVRFRAVRHVR